MANDRDSPYKLFSASNDHIGAECPKCGRVLKIPRRRAAESTAGFDVQDGIVCPCGHEATAVHRPPPKPKPPEKRPSLAETIFAQGLVWGVIGAVLLGGGYLVFSVVSGVGAAFDGNESEPVPDLSASVSVSGGQVHVTNYDSFDWTGCEITLNAGLGGSWSQTVGRIPGGETVRGGLMAFTRRRGERFNPLTHAVEDVFLDCVTPAGRSTWAGRF